MISLLDKNDNSILLSIELCITKINNNSFSYEFYKEFSNILTKIHNKLYKGEYFNRFSETLKKVIFDIVHKISTGNLSYQEQLSFTRFGVDRIFLLGSIHKIEYNDKNTVEQIINMFSKSSEYDKVGYCHSLLIPLYQTSTPEIKNIISKFIKSINFNMLDESIKIVFKIQKINTKIEKYSDVDLAYFKEYIDNLDPKTYSTMYDSVYLGLKNAHKIFRRKIFRELAEEIKKLINNFMLKRGLELIE